jgi:hypothetical protein
MIVGKTLDLDSNAYLHVDESLSNPTPTPFPLTLVE